MLLSLSGYDEAERFTEQCSELDESEITLLNDKLQYLHITKANHPTVSITYFVKDLTKEGGSCETITGTLKNIDAVFCYVVMDDGTLVPISDICSIDL